MTRFEFLKSIGFGGAALVAVLTSCQKSDVSPDTSSTGSTSSGPVDFTLDLTATANAALKSNGGYVLSNGVVVARTSQGVYVAATHTCSHEARQNVLFQSDIFYCNVHGARFSTDGKGLNSFGSNGLTVYTTELHGDSLRVHS